MTRYCIVIDDEDREQDEARPWTASLFDEGGEMVLPEAGIGATPAEAASDLIRNWSES